MNEGAMELLRECRLLIIRLRNEARTGTGRDTISRIDALLAQSKAAPESKCVWLIERGQQENHSPTIWWRAAAWESLPYAGQWTEDANQARHFLTADEAHHCALVHVKHFFRIVEHVFLKAAPQITEPERTEVAEATRTSASAAPDSGEMPEEPKFTIPDYPSRSFQKDRGIRTVPWDDWVGMQLRALELREYANLLRSALVEKERELEIQRQAKVDAQDQAWMLSGKLEAAEARAGEAEKERKEKT